MSEFDPPADPFGNDIESRECKFCNKEMAFHENSIESWFSCENIWCPEKFFGRYRDMADYIVELEYEVEYLKDVIQRITRSKS